MNKHQKGLAIVEFTIVLPLLLFLLFAVLDFGRVMYAGIVINSSARVAAGYGAQSIDKSVDIDGMTDIANLEAQQIFSGDDENPVTLSVENLMQCSCDDGSNTEINVEEDCDTSSSCTISRYISVDVNYTFKTIVPYPFIPDKVALHRQATMRLE